MVSMDLLVASNAGPYDFADLEDYETVRQGRKEVSPGGLTKGLLPAVGDKGRWVCAARGDADMLLADENGHIVTPEVTMTKVNLDDELYRSYYGSFSNGYLWPLHHLATERLDQMSETFPTPDFNPLHYENYAKANERFAETINREAQAMENPLVMINDYHLMLAAAGLNDIRSGYFQHIPEVGLEELMYFAGRSPQEKTAVERLTQGRLVNSVVGFHVQRFLVNFLQGAEYLIDGLNIQDLNEGYRVTTPETEHSPATNTVVRKFPIGTNIGLILQEAHPDKKLNHRFTPYGTSEEVDLEALVERNRQKGIVTFGGMERNDYTKGGLERLQILDELLERGHELMYVGFAQKSRTIVGAYQSLDDKVKNKIKEINETHSTRLGYNPVLMDVETGIPFRENFRFLRDVDVVLLPTLMDGMNLVIQETIAANHQLPREQRSALAIGPSGANDLLELYHGRDGIARLQPLNIKSSADRLERMLEDGVQTGDRLSDAVTDYVVRNCNITDFTRDFLDTLEAAPTDSS